MSLIDTVRKVLSSLSPSAVDDVGAAATGGTKVVTLAKLPPPVVNAIAEVAKKLLETDPPEAILKALRSHKLADRVKAMSELYELIVSHIAKSNIDLNAKSFELILEKIGVEALLLIPACADSYRRHLSAGGTAATFKDYVLSRKNRELYAAMKGALIRDEFLKLLGVTEETFFTFANHALRSTPDARNKVLVSLNRLMDTGVPPDLFFRILFSKAGENLIPLDKFDDLFDAMAKLLQTGKLPDAVTAEQAARVFKIANRSALQGPIGELLALEKQIGRATDLSKQQKGPVYILLRTSLESVRTSVPRKAKSRMRGLPSTIEVPDDPKGFAKAEALFEMEAAGTTAKRPPQEYTDGIIVSFDGKGGVRGLLWTEVKTDQRGIKNGLEQFSDNNEGIDNMIALSTDAVVRVENGKVEFLSMADAAKAVGGEASVVDGKLRIVEKEDVAGKLKALEEAQAKLAKPTAASIAEINEVRAELKFRSFKSMKRELYVGAEQSAALAGEAVGNVRVRDYGHDYSTVVDVVATMLATMGFKSL